MTPAVRDDFDLLLAVACFPLTVRVIWAGCGAAIELLLHLVGGS